MKPYLVRRSEAVHPDSIAGRVLCHDLRHPMGRIAFGKGRVLKAEDIPALLDLPWTELHLIEPEAGDLHEQEAGERIAAAAAGEGIRVGRISASHWPLSAHQRGILDVRVEALRRVNRVEGISVYTLYSGQVIDAGEVVARAKIIPLVLAAERVREAENIAIDSGGVVRIRPFRRTRIGAVVLESLGDRGMERFRDALGEKVRWFGSELLEPVPVEPDEQQVANAVERLASRGAEIVVLAGARAMDPLDPALRALIRLGIAPERHGVPAHPGSLFWLARLGEVPILGMPGCGLFSRATVFDLVLPRLLTGERIGAAELAELGHGGFLTRDMAFRFPPYRVSRERGDVS